MRGRWWFAITILSNRAITPVPRHFPRTGGADVGGDAKAFAASFNRYSRYEPTIGEPTDIHIADDRQYVNVGITVKATLAKNGRVVDLAGPVMLRRPLISESAHPPKADWRIWGVDIRSSH